MLFAAAAIIVGTISTAIAIRLSGFHISVKDVPDTLAADVPGAQLAATPVQVSKLRSEDVLFTESLLALGKVGLRVPGGSPSPSTVESSSLVSVRPAR